MQPIVIQGSTSIAAGGSNPNVLSDTRIVQSPVTGRCSLFLQSNGGNPGEVTASFKVNSDEILVQDSVVGNSSRLPETDKDGYFRNVFVRSGDRLTLQGANGGAGAQNLYWRVVLQPTR